MMRALLLLACTVGALAGPGVSRAAAETGSLEYQVKAVCLYNFVKFIDWPKEAFKGGDELNICIIGRNPFGAVTRELDGREAQGKHVHVMEFPSDTKIEDLQRCNLAYLGSAGPASEALLSAPPNHLIATVSDDNPKAILRFQVVDGKVRFAVNLDAADHARLKISSQLLKLAINTQ